MPPPIAIGDLIRPPSYSGQTDTDLFIVLARVERGVRVPLLWDERNTFGSAVATDLHAGWICLRLNKANPDAERVPYHNDAQREDMLVWRDHPNVTRYDCDEYYAARKVVRLHEYRETMRAELAKALQASTRFDTILSLLWMKHEVIFKNAAATAAAT